MLEKDVNKYGTSYSEKHFRVLPTGVEPMTLYHWELGHITTILVKSPWDTYYPVAMLFEVRSQYSIFRTPLPPKTMLKYGRKIGGIRVNTALGVGRGRWRQQPFVVENMCPKIYDENCSRFKQICLFPKEQISSDRPNWILSQYWEIKIKNILHCGCISHTILSLTQHSCLQIRNNNVILLVQFFSRVNFPILSIL